jgi:hypothetical protein
MSGNEIISVAEYRDEGFAIIEDTKGKFIVTKESDQMIPLYDNKTVEAYFGRRQICALLRSQERDAMLT